MDTKTESNNDPSRSDSGAQVALTSQLSELGFRAEDLLWERKPGQVELNPLLLARIAERIQFDGDVPEFRSGNMLEGGKPAVPVHARTWSPVLLGRMLHVARDEVQKELEAARSHWEQQEEAIASSTNQLPVFETDGYAAGRIPLPRNVVVDPIEGESLPHPEKQLAAFSAVATTQGRISAVDLLTESLLEGLLLAGWENVQKGRGATAVAQFGWKIQINQAGETNPRFSPMMAAKASLLRSLLSWQCFMKEGKIEVLPINTISDRVVGWKVVVYE